VVDSQGHVYFIYSAHGVMRIETSGEPTNIHPDGGGHWLALDSSGSFSRVTPKLFERITPDGSVPSLIFASGGAPLVVGQDGDLYYGTNGSPEDSFAPGALTVARLSPAGKQELFASRLQSKLSELKDGITGLAEGPGGSIYIATWRGILKLSKDGSIATIRHPLIVQDCDSDPADHNPANVASSLFRGLGVDAHWNVYVAATSCHRVLKITPGGAVETILKSERPWSPTGESLRDKTVYVLEYTNANGSPLDGWYPRVRKRSPDGKWKTLISMSR
jgi:hypothetical protein